MPNVRVAAAACGLPENTEADFHLGLGRAIARAGADIYRADDKIDAIGATNAAGAGLLRMALEQIYDREEALIRALAACPAATLAGATIQLAAAVKIFGWITVDDTPRPEDERAINRLMASALRVMVDVAGLDVEQDGVGYLAPPITDPWRDVYQRLAELFPETSVEGDRP